MSGYSQPQAIRTLIYILALAACLAAYLTVNPLLTVGCVLTLLLLGKLLWRPGEPPVLILVAGLQWVQVATLVLEADVNGSLVSTLSPSPSIESAIWLSLIGLLVLALGIRFGTRHLRPVPPAAIQEELRQYSIDRLFYIYLAFAFFSISVPYVAWRVLPLRQVLLLLGSEKWVCYMVLGYATLGRRAKVVYFVVATLLEIIAGIGFFSGFKMAFIVGALVMFGLKLRLRLRTVLATTIVAIAAFIASLGWKAIREDYRSFLNKGTGQQVVLVSPAEQVRTFGAMMFSVNEDALTGSVDLIVKRLAYVDYFAAALDYVPKHRGYENGNLLVRTIIHVLVPRFLYPSKEVLISDSDVTMRYTGLTIPSAEQGTSISLGYMAETYIDFGPYGMFVPILLFGLCWGWMYRWLINHSRRRAIGFAFATILLLSASQFEMAQTKLVGAMVSQWILFAVLLRYAMPRVERWLVARGRDATRGSAMPASATAEA